MRTREEIEKIKEKGLYHLETSSGLCSVIASLGWGGYISRSEKTLLMVEIKKMSKIQENKNRKESFFLGKAYGKKEIRSYIFLLAIEKLYSEREL